MPSEETTGTQTSGEVFVVVDVICDCGELCEDRPSPPVLFEAEARALKLAPRWASFQCPRCQSFYDALITVLPREPLKKEQTP